MQGVLEQNRIAEAVISRHEEPLGEKIGFFGKLFGCWHRELSRPFTDKKLTYRTCLGCGARREFDTDTLITSGPFYYPPTVRTSNT